MSLSLRLKNIVEMLDYTEHLLDVGCDHAYASIEAVQTHKAKHVTACDVRKGPLEQAKKNISESSLSEKIDTLLSDGIREIIKSEAMKPDGMIIAGMGGQLMLDILKAEPTDGHKDINQAYMTEKATKMIKAMKSIVLSPQSEPELVRHYIIDELKLNIIDELSVFDEGRYYTLIKIEGRKSDKDTEDSVLRNEPKKYVNEIYYKYGLISCIKREKTFLDELRHLREKYLAAMELCKNGSSKNAINKYKDLNIKISEIDMILNNKAEF